MIDQFTCPNCGTQVENQNSLCDECDSEYLGTHIGGRMEKKCNCDICTALGMFWKNKVKESIKGE